MAKGDLEIWGQIDGYPNYQVSSHGRIKRMPVYVNAKGGVQKYLKETLLNPSPDGGGYLMASIGNDNGKKRPKVHRLVASVFIDNPLHLKEVNHINGNRKDNRVENLEWCDRLTNQRQAALLGRYKHKLSFADIEFIRHAVIFKIKRQIELAKMFNVHQSHINKIVKRTRRTFTS